MGKYAAQPGIYLEELSSIQVILPNLEEQASIVAYVQMETAPITTAISRLEHGIELLREYRTRLIADVVTGKLDVRAAAARLPVAEGSEELVGNGDVWVEDGEAANDEMPQDDGTDDV